MIIKSKTKNYKVDIINTWEELENIISSLSNPFFVTDKKLYELYKDFFSKFDTNPFLLEAIEDKKTIQTALDICEVIAERPSKRNTTLISFGGGITQDITGFVANIMYRGIKWIFVPTTLLAACDSCIGGKTSLNFGKFKNLLGTFFPPDEILIQPDFFQTLSQSDLMSGLGEIVKFHVMMGEKGLAEMEDIVDTLLKKDKLMLSKTVNQSLHFKKTFIEEDEFDKGKRILLNFAHTFGHALEVSSNYEIPHGSAVALGMLAAGCVSEKRNLLDPKIQNRVLNLVKKIIPFKLKPEWLNSEVLAKAIKMDKKQTGKGITAVLLNKDFNLNIYNDLETDEIKIAFDYLQNNIII